MSTMVTPNQIWNTMPGWGIVADLTPPELIESRRLKVLRKLLAAIIAAIVVVCVGVFVLAYLGKSSAQDALAAEQGRTNSLIASQSKYASVTQIQTHLTQINGKVSTLMTGDVDIQPLLAKFAKALPASLDVKTLAVSLASTANNAALSSGLDTSGHRIIGSVTISGDALTFKGVSSYVDALAAIDGVVNVVPTSAQNTKVVINYNITLNITDQVLSHRFDAKEKGGS
jgi:hypothetical protein